MDCSFFFFILNLIKFKVLNGSDEEDKKPIPANNDKSNEIPTPDQHNTNNDLLDLIFDDTTPLPASQNKLNITVYSK